MACQITISDPVGQETTIGQGITTLTISGTAIDCSTVHIRVHQTQPVDVFTPQKTVTVSNGEWSVDFTQQAGDFPLGTFLCGTDNKYEIEAECADNSSCNAKLSGDLINCGNCPEVNITITPGDCINGRRTVHLRADVVSASEATYTWFFGTDEDNQPGEDSQTGDGSGNPWLPAPNSSGIRVVEVDHVYEPTGDQLQTITVRFITSSSPASVCSKEKEFDLEPCRCELTVSLHVSDQTGQEFSAEDCLSPGNYSVQVTSPVGNDINYSWSVNGVANNSQNGPIFNFTISAGEQKTVSVFIEQGGCTASNAVMVRGCEDCSDFDTQIRILDANRRNVTDENCLPPGNYTIEATSPLGAGNTFRWIVDNIVDTTATGTTLQVSLGNNDEKVVTLQASRGECSDLATVVLEACPPEDDDDEDDDDGNEGSDGFIPCLLFKMLALIGLGLVFLGVILLLCPAVAMPFPPQVAVAIGTGLVVGGGLLLTLGLLLWFLICRPDQCDWFAFLWQSLILLGLLMIYAGFCPACSWMLLGVIPLILGAGASVLWGRNCDVTRCGILAEWISLFTFVVNVVAILEGVLAACVISTQPIATFIWGLMIAAIQAWLWFEANRNNCIQN